MARVIGMAPSRRRLLLGTLAALPLPALAQAARVTDVLGREYPLAAPAQRLVVMLNYEDFTAIGGLGAWARVAGINRVVWEGWRPAIFSRYRALIPALGAMPDVGNTDEGTFSAEKVISLRPDLVLMPAWIWSAAQTTRDQIAAAGIPIMVFDYNAQTLERHIVSTRLFGAAIGEPARADRLADRYRRSVEDIQERIARQPGGSKPRVHFELGQAGADTIGNSYAGTMWGRIANNLGAENIADGRLAGPWGPLAAETVLAADPDAIFIAGSSWLNRPNSVRTGYDATAEETRRSLAPYAARPTWRGLAAIRNGELHAVEHGMVRTLFDDTATLYIAKRLWPGAFQDRDPVAELAAYHRDFLPVPYSGTWMLPWRS
jgi:iron complex transport system substrate-binding protein